MTRGGHMPLGDTPFSQSGLAGSVVISAFAGAAVMARPVCVQRYTGFPLLQVLADTRLSFVF